MGTARPGPRLGQGTGAGGGAVRPAPPVAARGRKKSRHRGQQATRGLVAVSPRCGAARRRSGTRLRPARRSSPARPSRLPMCCPITDPMASRCRPCVRPDRRRGGNQHRGPYFFSQQMLGQTFAAQGGRPLSGSSSTSAVAAARNRTPARGAPLADGSVVGLVHGAVQPAHDHLRPRSPGREWSGYRPSVELSAQTGRGRSRT